MEQDQQYTNGYGNHAIERKPIYYGRYGNSIGTAGFILSVLAVLCFWIPVLGQVLWFLGLVFSCLGMLRKPKSFAVAGLILSLAGLVLFALGVFFFVATTVFSPLTSS